MWFTANYKSHNKMELDQKAIQSQFLSAMLSNPWWMDYAQKKQAQGGNGTMQEILLKISLEYASELVRLK